MSGWREALCLGDCCAIRFSEGVDACALRSCGNTTRKIDFHLYSDLDHLSYCFIAVVLQIYKSYLENDSLFAYSPASCAS